MGASRLDANMRENLLGNMADEPPRSRRSPLSSLPRLRGGNEAVNAMAGVTGCCVAFFFVMSMFIASVSPLEYGLKKNNLNGVVFTEHVQGGLHIVAPWQSYLTFPATRVTLEWSNSYNADRPMVNTRTGADPNDPDSGGQPLGISCAVQIRLIPEKLREVFLNFGSYTAAKQRYILLAGNMVSNTAQEFTPQDFWTHRNTIASRMLGKLNNTLLGNGAEAVSFEIMKVDFAHQFEQSITGVQVAEQQKVVNEYSQQVQQVEQQIAVLNSHNVAKIATINANAMRLAKEMVGNATKAAFVAKQDAKAVNYQKLKEELELTSAQFAEYIKIRSLMAQSSAGGKVVVSVAPPSVEAVAVGPSGETRHL